MWGEATYVVLGREDGTLSAVLEGMRNFAYAYNAGRWRNEKHVGVVADSNGDGRMDLIGFGNRGMFFAGGKVYGRFDAIVNVLNEFVYEREWGLSRNRTYQWKWMPI